MNINERLSQFMGIVTRSLLQYSSQIHTHPVISLYTKKKHHTKSPCRRSHYSFRSANSRCRARKHSWLLLFSFFEIFLTGFWDCRIVFNGLYSCGSSHKPTPTFYLHEQFSRRVSSSIVSRMSNALRQQWVPLKISAGS